MQKGVRLIFHSVLGWAESSMEKTRGRVAAHCLWQERGREGIKTISSLVLLL